MMLQAYQAQSTERSHLTKSDVMTALGMVQKHNGAGMALVMARYCKDLGDAKKALLAVQAECAKIAPAMWGPTRNVAMAWPCAGWPSWPWNTTAALLTLLGLPVTRSSAGGGE